MNLKRIAAFAVASCMTLLLGGCGVTSSSDSDSTAIPADAPSLEEIYAANTLEAYMDANIQPSLTTCLREGEENTETNALLTIYHNDDLGLVSRFRQTNMSFVYYFNQAGTDFYCSQDEDQNTLLTILVDDPDENSDEDEKTSYAEELFDKYSFGDYNSEEKMISCTDSGDTYHIVTDISALSFTDSTGQTYTYTTQEYDVEKETLRILDVFRTYTVTDSDGSSKECTWSRCMTYGKKLVDLPDFILDDICSAEWSREITLVAADGTEKTVSVPNGIPVLVEAPSGYEAYTDSDCETVYHADQMDENGNFPNRTIYIAEKE